MKELYKNGYIAHNGELMKKDLLICGDTIIGVDNKIEADAKIIDVEGKMILPKLIDEHTHGSFGVDFNLATKEEMLKCVDFLKTQKVGTVFPTLLTDEIDVMKSQIKKLVQASKQAPEIKGIHLEGPFLCSQYKGAMPEYLLKEPDVKILDELLEAGEGLVKLMTISPEVEGAPEFVREATRRGITINLGHSGASYKQTMACIEQGANGFTHTGNAMKQIHQHEIGVWGTAMLSCGYCEAICDGLHLNEHMVQLLLKVKGLDRMIIITDCIMAGGLPDGDYKLGVNDVVVVNGDAKLKENDTRAGSTLTAINCLTNFQKFTSLPLEKAILAMTKNPAEHCNIYNKTGSIEVGKKAEFFIY